jgi:hypothetical protein
MKRILIISCLVLAGFFRVQASDADLFSYSKQAVVTAVSELSVIESFVTSNPAISLVDLMKTGNYMVNGIEVNTNPFGINGEPPLGIPSFLWGCVLGWVGLLIVYMVSDQDKEETKKALWGCITSTAVGLIIYLAVAVIFVSSSTAVVNTYP